MKIDFDGGLKLEFHGAKVTSDGGLLAYRDLDHALGLCDSLSASFIDKRIGRNIQHAMSTLLRQSMYSRDKSRRVVSKVEWYLGELFPRVGFIVTNMSAKPEDVVHFYNGRGTAEQWIKEGKYALNWIRLSCKRFVSNKVRLWSFVPAYNL